MSKRNIYIDFDKPVSQKEFDLFKEILQLYDLEFLGTVNPKNINGILSSTNVFHLIKGPLIRALDQSGLRDRVKIIDIS